MATTDRCAVFYARVVDGKPKILNRDGFMRLIEQMNGREIDIMVRKHRKARSTNQNSFYWGVVLAIIAESTGNEPEDMHAAFRDLFLTDRSGPLPLVRSTTDLSTVEFNEYIEKIVRFAAEKLELVIPDPQ